MTRDDRGGVRKRMGERGREEEEKGRTGSGSGQRGSDIRTPNIEQRKKHRVIRERRKVHVRAITGGRGRPITMRVQADQCEAIFPY